MKLEYHSGGFAACKIARLVGVVEEKKANDIHGHAHTFLVSGSQPDLAFL